MNDSWILFTCVVGAIALVGVVLAYLPQKRRAQTYEPMKYRGFTARIEYSAEDDCFVGQIDGIKDIVGFHGDCVAELKAEFRDSVDHYLNSCAFRCVDPAKAGS